MKRYQRFFVSNSIGRLDPNQRYRFHEEEEDEEEEDEDEVEKLRKYYINVFAELYACSEQAFEKKFAAIIEQRENAKK